MSEQYRNFKRILWVQKEDNIHTVGFNEDALDDFEKILSVDLPREGESVDAGLVCGSIDTDNGPIDVYAPVTGVVLEINSLVLEDPTLIQDDPYDTWLLKIESEEDLTDEDDEDSDTDEDEDEDDEDEEIEDEDDED